ELVRCSETTRCARTGSEGGSLRQPCFPEAIQKVLKIIRILEWLLLRIGQNREIRAQSQNLGSLSTGLFVPAQISVGGGEIRIIPILLWVYAHGGSNYLFVPFFYKQYARSDFPVPWERKWISQCFRI